MSELRQPKTIQRPTPHFTLRFREVPYGDPTNEPSHPYLIELEIGGQPAGTLALYEAEWSAIWQAMVNATPAFERSGITLTRTGKFR
jgi:hypothetical protein